MQTPQYKHTRQCFTPIKPETSVLRLVCIVVSFPWKFQFAFLSEFLQSLFLFRFYWDRFITTRLEPGKLESPVSVTWKFVAQETNKFVPVGRLAIASLLKLFKPLLFCEQTKNRCDYLQRILFFLATLSLRVTFACFVYFSFALPVWCCYNVFHSIVQSEDFDWEGMEYDDMELDDRSVTLSIETPETEQGD